MAEDARFEDGGETPLRLKAVDQDDLQIISSLTQDAIFPASEMTWDQTGRRFAMLVNRFRWEDVPAAERRGRKFERVQSVLMIGDVLKVESQGVDRADPDVILSLLSIEFHAGVDGTGRLELMFAGDGAIALDVEALDVTLKDVTRPYAAPSNNTPDHG
jgi:hypothetical protein